MGYVSKEVCSDICSSSVLGTFIPAKHFSRILVEEKAPGSIVMIASMSGQIANRVCCIKSILREIT